MTTTWRSFEKLVSRIEHALAGESVTVKSPDRIPCITTGMLREVDVSIRTRIGSAEILITVECRDRVAVQDVTWIEQLAAKKENIGVAKTIAVAASGFSPEATRIARENAIDLRILDEISGEDIKSWLGMVGMVHVFKDCGLNGSPKTRFSLETGDDALEMTGQSASSPITSSQARVANRCHSKTFGFVRMTKRRFLIGSPRDDKDYLVTLTITPTDKLQLCTPKGNRRVRAITMPLRLRWKHEFIPLSNARAVSYKAADTEDPLPEHVFVEFQTKEATSENLRVGFLLQPGDGQVRLRGLAERLPAEPPTPPTGS